MVTRATPVLPVGMSDDLARCCGVFGDLGGMCVPSFAAIGGRVVEIGRKALFGNRLSNS